MSVLQDVQCVSQLGIVVFYVTDVFAVHKCQVLLVCPMYALSLVLHVSFYMSLLSWSCVVSCVLGLFSCCRVFVLLNAIFMSVCLKGLVIFVTFEL